MLRALVMLVALLTGCPRAPDVQLQIARGISTAANATLPALRAEYLREGRAMIAAGVAAGEDRAALMVRLAALDEAWSQVSRAWSALALAHEAYAVAVTSGADPIAAASRLRDAWCDLRAALPPGATLPAVPMLSCPEVPR